MDRNLDRALTRLSRGSFMHFDGGRGLSVFVLRGQIWATQFGDRRDLIVGRGRLLALDKPGLAVLEALEDTVLLVVDAAAPALPAAIETGLAGQPGLAGAARQRSTVEMTAWEVHMMARRQRAQLLARLQRRAAAGLRGIWRRLTGGLWPRAAAAEGAASGPNGERVASHAQRA